MKRFIFVVAVLLAVATLGATAVLAAPGGNGNGKARGFGNGNGNSTSATLVSSCNPCDAGTVVHFWGSGYDASQGKALINVNGAVTATIVNPDGTISFDWPYFNVPGSFSVETYQTKGKKPVLMADVTLVIE